MKHQIRDPQLANRPWVEIVDRFEERYKIVDWIWLNVIDSNLNELYSYWAQYKDRVFEHNERIVLINHELMYYPDNSNISHSLYNLFATLQYFNIPSDFLVFLVNYPADDEIGYLTNLFNLPMPTIINNEHWVDRINPGITETPALNIDNIKKPFMCLNGRSRAHRIDILCLLEEYNLIDKGIVTYNFANELAPSGCNAPPMIPDLPNTFAKTGLFYRTTIPFSRDNSVYAKNQLMIDAFSKHGKKFIGQTKKHELATDYEHFERFILESNIEFDRKQTHSHFIQNSAVFFVVESVINYPHPYFTEKTWKPIMYSRPFIIASTPHTLKKLRSLGFKTFHEFWDESYDDVENTASRMCHLVDTVKQISDIPLPQLKEVIQEMAPILEHNINVYREIFSKTDLQKVLNQI